jgi:hypothetical protein
LKKFTQKKWLGIPIVAVIAILLSVAVIAAVSVTLATKNQHVTQTITVAPAGTIVVSDDPITLPSMAAGTEFSVPNGTVTVTVNTAPATLHITTDTGNYV